MSFEMTNIQYDSTRKTGVTQTFKVKDTTDNKTLFHNIVETGRESST